MEDFDRSVFINCPFDDDYAPILKAVAFVVILLGFSPRLATERSDSGETRLDKIKSLIEASRWSIHDLSRCQATTAGEVFRLNMPFELGIDWGCRQYFGAGRDRKRFLILEEQRFRFQAALSDISGCDIESHAGDHETAMAKVRNWLRHQTGTAAEGPERISGRYADFQAWNFADKIRAGYSERDLLRLPTFEFLEAIRAWKAGGMPTINSLGP